MVRIYRSILRCPGCGRCAVHELTYAGRMFVSSRCGSCGYAFECDVLPLYFDDLVRRVASKPASMVRGFRQHPLSYLCGLPVLAITKPVGVLDELRRVIRPRVTHARQDKRRHAHPC